jgi:hypothetical protein
MPALRQEPGKLIERTWITRAADGRKVRHTALGYDLTVNGKRERKFSSAWLTERDVLDALARRRRELGQGLEPVADWTPADLAREYLASRSRAAGAGATSRRDSSARACSRASGQICWCGTSHPRFSPGTSTSGPARWGGELYATNSGLWAGRCGWRIVSA